MRVRSKYGHDGGQWDDPSDPHYEWYEDNEFDREAAAVERVGAAPKHQARDRVAVTLTKIIME